MDDSSSSHRRIKARVARWFRARRGRSLSVAVDLTHLEPGGGNGGVKPLTYAFLEDLANVHRLRLTLLARPPIHAELRPLVRNPEQIVSAETFPSVEQRSVIRGHDVLYSPVGYTSWADGSIPAVCLIVDLLHRDHPEFLPPDQVAHRELLYQQTIRQTTLWHCNSEFARASVIRHYGVPRERTFVAFNAIHSRFNRASRGKRSAPSEQPHFLYPANFWPHKNHETLLVAYRLHEREFGADAWPLVLTGHESQEAPRIRHLAGVLGLRGLQINGYVERDRLQHLWETAGALVFPSLFEGFGIPLIEAMWFGVPILAGPQAAIPEVVRHAALLVDVHSPEALAAGMARMAREKPLRDMLIAAGRRRLASFVRKDESGKLADALRRAPELHRRLHAHPS